MAIRIADLLPVRAEVEVAPGKMLPVRPLTLEEMLRVFVTSQEAFVGLYSRGLGMSSQDELMPFLIAAPDVVASIVAVGADVPDQLDDVRKLPATVQLIALYEIWKLSVPDAKKAQELLSEVTAQLRKLSQKAQKDAKPAQMQPPSPSGQTLPQESNSSAPTDTPTEKS